jgi:hypothetical protein
MTPVAACPHTPRVVEIDEYLTQVTQRLDGLCAQPVGEQAQVELWRAVANLAAAVKAIASELGCPHHAARLRELADRLDGAAA